VTTDLLLGVGVAAHLPCDEELTLADAHPSTHPGFQLRVSVTDSVVTSADPAVGLMHRSAEKLFEARDYRQAMLLANRHDWLSAFSNEVGVALAIESSLGITPPERATWTRTLLAELNRVFASLAFLAPVAGPARPDVDALREHLTVIQERVTGARVHPGFARIGGVAAPVAPTQLSQVEAAMDRLIAIQPMTTEAVDSYAAPLSGIARLSGDDALAFATSGTVAWASGLDLDLRRDDPYLAYGELAPLLQVPVRTQGDVPARYGVLLDQLPVSAVLVRACVEQLRRLGDGPVDVPLPKVVRLPEGITYAWIEGPIGISGCLIASAGDRTPWRMKIRSASFATMPAMAHALPGTPYPRLADAVMSFPFVMGDVDR
jgi:NADH-quinone oxidoreductase subunit D